MNRVTVMKGFGMATEVTCGQCHGRLLIETPGVVVACPHCGVHLSIPIPPQEPVAEPEPAAKPEPIAEPVLERDTDVAIPTELVDQDPGHIELNFGSPEPSTEVLSDESHAETLASTSLFGDADEQHDHGAEVGWHSAPRLHLGQGEALPSVDEIPTHESSEEPAPALFTAPLMGLTPDSSPVPEADQTVAMFPSFGEAPRSVDPTWNFSPAEAATSPPDTVFLSSSQQFTIGDSVEESPTLPEQPMFSLEGPAEAPDFATTALAFDDAGTAPTITLPGAVTDDLILSSSQQFSLGAVAATLAAATEATSGSATPIEAPPIAMASPVPAVSSPASAPVEAAASSQQKVLVLLLLIVGSYASAITIVLIYFLAAGRAHQLESLPDLKPAMKKGEVTVTHYYSPKNDLPPGHVLKLGESQRFGSLRVTPVKVTRGPVLFEHYSGKSALQREATQPLLKLWLKFENVSRDQTFSPLDSLLVFKRSNQNRGAKVSANNFLSTVEDRKRVQSIFRVYDMPIHSEFAMVGQKLDTELPPGESWQTFVPSEEDAAQLKGDLVWRVQIRKGYHPKSFRGVTTLIDVEFNSQDISNET